MPAVAFRAGKLSGTTGGDLGKRKIDLKFSNWNGTTDYVTILGSGNVGIGTTGPGALLHLNYNDGTRVTQIFENDDNVAGQEIGQINFQALDSNSVAQGYAFISAEIGSPTAGAEQGVLQFQTFDAGVNGNRLTINGGNVGIGTTSPSAVADIVGNLSGSTGALFRVASASELFRVQ